MSFYRRFVLVGLSLSLAAPLGCAAATDDGPDDSAQSEDALTGLKAGHYAVARAPYSGSYISKLTISANKKVELEYVRVSAGYSNPWMPWLSTSTKETLSLRGTYMTFAGDPGQTLISFDVTDRRVDHLIYSFTSQGGSLVLKAIGGSEFTLKPSSADTTPTDARVLTCKGGRWDATITLDQNQRRNGKMKVTRHADADRTDPPNITLDVAYTGNTGVDDWMGYDGVDSKGNGYSFALRPRDVETVGAAAFQIGLGYTPDMSPGGWHNTLQCKSSR